MDELTKSKDPKLMAARLFIGCLPSHMTSREELEEKFLPYGKILGLSIHQGFAFVQYDDERSAQAAVESEQGCYFKGKRLDLKISTEGRKPGYAGPGPLKRPFEDFGPRRPYDDHFRPRPPAPWERERFGATGPYRDDPYRFAAPMPPPAVVVSADSFQPPTSYPGAATTPTKKNECGVERPFDSVVIAVNKHLRTYSELIERKLIELNMTVDIIFLVHENALLKAIDDMARRGVLYILIVQQQHEERKSITVNIMHGPPQEHRNMPLDDALMMLARNFKAYLSSLRSGSEQPSMGFLLNLLADSKHLSVAELDRIIAHLQDRRDRMIEAEGGKVATRDPAPATGSTNSTPEQLHQRILSILGTNSGGASNPPSTAGNPTVSAPTLMGSNPTSMFSSMVQQLGLNLNPSAAPTSTNVSSPTKPTVVSMAGGSFDQKSLDKLLQNPALLKTLVPEMAGATQTGMKPPVASTASTTFTNPDPNSGKMGFPKFAGNNQQKPPMGVPSPQVGPIPTQIRPHHPSQLPGTHGTGY